MQTVGNCFELRVEVPIYLKVDLPVEENRTAEACHTTVEIHQWTNSGHRHFYVYMFIAIWYSSRNISVNLPQFQILCNRQSLIVNLSRTKQNRSETSAKRKCIRQLNRPSAVCASEKSRTTQTNAQCAANLLVNALGLIPLRFFFHSAQRGVLVTCCFSVFLFYLAPL